MGNPKDSSVGQFFTKQVAPNLNPLDSSGGRFTSGLLTGDYNKALQGGGEMLGGAIDLNKNLLGGAAKGLTGLRGDFEREEAAGRQANDVLAQQEQAQTRGFYDQQGQQEQQAQQGLAKRNKANADYIGNYNKGIADEDALKALEDARNSTRRKQGRTINFG